MTGWEGGGGGSRLGLISFPSSSREPKQAWFQFAPQLLGQPLGSVSAGGGFHYTEKAAQVVPIVGEPQ